MRGWVSGVLLCLTVGLSQGADEFCMVNGVIDPGHSQHWQFSLRYSEPQAMQQVVGSWLVTNTAQTLGLVQRMQVNYHDNGLFDYVDETCSSVSCSYNEGHGRWTARFEADGLIYIMINVSDLNRTNECTGFAALVLGDYLYSRDGGAPAVRLR